MLGAGGGVLFLFASYATLVLGVLGLIIMVGVVARRRSVSWAPYVGMVVPVAVGLTGVLVADSGAVGHRTLDAVALGLPIVAGGAWFVGLVSAMNRPRDVEE